MKHLLLTTIAAVLVVGYGESQSPHTRHTADSQSSIHVAVLKGNIEAVKQHLAAGTDVNAKNSNGITPLHTAASRGRKEIVELLIAKGADVSAKMKDGRTPLDAAIRRGRTETADLPRKHGGKTKKELEVAARPSRQQRSESSNNSDKEKALELLFGTDSTITEKDEAFLSAAKKGELDKVKSLLAGTL